MVHIYKLNGFNIVVDSNSGTIHVVDNVAYEIIKNYNKNTQEEIINKLKERFSLREITEAFDEIEYMKKEGMLFSKDEFENIAKKWEKQDSRVKALCLNVAHICNLRCKYCFASQGNYKTKEMLMPFEIARKAVEFLIENSGTLKNIEIDFFGGEPLLNFDVIRRTVDYARSIENKYDKKFFFTITTNGTLLTDEIIDYLNENMGNVVISIDGRKEIHDAMRCYPDGRGSYDDIVPKAQKLVRGRKGKQYYIRGTFTAKNLDFTNDVKHLADLGFKEISLEPVTGKGEEWSITEKMLPRIFEEYERLADYLIESWKRGKDIKFYHFNLNIFEGPCFYKRLTGCGTGYEYLAVTPTGDIYPCHQFVGLEEFKLGDLLKGIERKDFSQYFRESHIYSKEKCKNCWAKFYCSGGCHADAYFSTGDIRGTNNLYCELQKKKIECAIMLQIIKKLGTGCKLPIKEMKLS